MGGDDGRSAAAERRGESEYERLDRNFTDLLQEIRVAQTGVQILFAFLLTLPFSARFGVTTSTDRVVYFVTLLSAAAASAFLIAPVSYHRTVFRQDRKAELVRNASRMAAWGTAFLLVAIVGAVFVVVDVVVDLTGAIIAAAGVGALGVFLWYLLPLARWRRTP